MPAGTRVVRLAAVTLGGVALLAGCAAPAPTAAPAGATCIDLATAQGVGLSWSQTSRFVGLGTVGPDGSPGARVVDTEGRSVGAPIDGRPGLVPESVVVTPDGRLAWLEGAGDSMILVEDREAGIVETPLPADIDGLGWTAIGFALLQHPAGGGTRILNLDVDRPDAPTVSFETDLYADRLWISADPETTLLTISHPDHRDAPVSFLVAGESEHQVEPAGADASGASMPSLRQWVVYHSAATARMEAIRVADPATAVTLHDGAAQRGMVSDRGVLAFVPAEPHGQLCLVDVASRLP